MRRWFIVLALLAVPAGALAQDGLRSGSLPERTPTNPIPPAPVDIYRVPPDFYNRPTPPLPSSGVPGGYYYYYWLGEPDWRRPRARSWWERQRDEWDRQRERDERAMWQPRGVRVEAAPAPAMAPLPPGKPKTFYVIPGCYAGDRRPEISRLPAGCREADLRVIPPA